MIGIKTKYNGTDLEFINLKDINKVLIVAHKFNQGRNVYKLMPNMQIKHKLLSNHKIVKTAYKSILNECNFVQRFPTSLKQK
jgi:hypothetical protein